MIWQDNWDRDHARLLKGDYEAFPHTNWIPTGSPENIGHRTPNFGKPFWEGQKEDITLLVNADFGMGDTIQFWRFMPLVKDRVARVFLRCDEDFKTLLTGVEIVGKDDPLPEFDKMVHMMSLPRVLGLKKNDISGQPYLKPNDEHQLPFELRATLPLGRGSKIGLCWQGNPFNPRDSLRSFPDLVLGQFLHWFPPQIHFFGLNKVGDIVSDRIWEMRGYMTDWNQTAQLLQFLDCVISVDTAVAHLAGALGVPVWLIVPTENPDWRWGTEGEKTLWYDSMTIFRRTGSWDDIVSEVAKAVIERPSFS